ncbi:hypothetical protein E2542_SST19650 [Spatholobus suberectus]|nr:hypothetical protein E2542_SST19650 [Spatholobus suberectus]
MRGTPNTTMWNGRNGSNRDCKQGTDIRPSCWVEGCSKIGGRNDVRKWLGGGQKMANRLFTYSSQKGLGHGLCVDLSDSVLVYMTIATLWKKDNLNWNIYFKKMFETLA